MSELEVISPDDAAIGDFIFRFKVQSGQPGKFVDLERPAAADGSDEADQENHRPTGTFLGWQEMFTRERHVRKYGVSDNQEYGKASRKQAADTFSDMDTWRTHHGQQE